MLSIAFNVGGTAFVMNAYQALPVLNIDANSSREEIKTAYRRMALELHPDRHGGRDNNEFKRITETQPLKGNRCDCVDGNARGAGYGMRFASAEPTREAR